MGTGERKRQEQEEREELMISHAGRLLLRDGFQGLNLDELARAIRVRQGTIYQHFCTKEDLVLAVATGRCSSGLNSLNAPPDSRAGHASGCVRSASRAASSPSCIQSTFSSISCCTPIVLAGGLSRNGGWHMDAWASAASG